MNMKNLKDFITESKPSFDVRSDVYNALTELAYAYHNKHKKFTQGDVEAACEWFIMNFFEEDTEGLVDDLK